MRSTRIVAMMVLFALLYPGVAYAETELISHEAETVTGLEIVANAVLNLTDIEVGSDEATLTMEVDGATQSFTVDYGEMLGGGEGGGSGLGSVALLGVAGTAFLRFLRLLMRLGS